MFLKLFFAVVVLCHCSYFIVTYSAVHVDNAFISRYSVFIFIFPHSGLSSPVILFHAGGFPHVSGNSWLYLPSHVWDSLLPDHVYYCFCSVQLQPDIVEERWAFWRKSVISRAARIRLLLRIDFLRVGSNGRKNQHNIETKSLNILIWNFLFFSHTNTNNISQNAILPGLLAGTDCWIKWPSFPAEFPCLQHPSSLISHTHSDFLTFKFWSPHKTIDSFLFQSYLLPIMKGQESRWVSG